MKQVAAAGLTLLILALASPPVVSFAGDDPPSGESTLDEFEDEATEEGGKHRHSGGKTRTRGHDHDHDCDHDCDDDWDDLLFVEFLFEVGKYPVYGTLWGGAGSLARAGGSVSEEWGVDFPRRRVGEPMVPVFVVEGLHQRVSSDIDARDFRAELGYGPLAVQVRSTRYNESRPDDTLRLTQLHGLYRMTFSPTVEIDLGFGSAELAGDRFNSGFSMTTPVRVYPWEFLSAEWRPSWSWMGGETVIDQSLTASANFSVLSVTAGYRWVTAGTVDLSGPTLGAGIRF